MREYELTVLYDLSVQEAGGPEASTERLKQLVEARGASMIKVDHWGRRRMAYPIRNAIDADYLVTRVEAEPSVVNSIEAALRIDEKVFRHLIVRADELPTPPPPREPRAEARPAPAPVEPATEEAAPAPPEATVADAPATETEAQAEDPTGEPAQAEDPTGEPAQAEDPTVEPAKA